MVDIEPQGQEPLTDNEFAQVDSEILAHVGDFTPEEARVFGEQLLNAGLARSIRLEEGLAHDKPMPPDEIYPGQGLLTALHKYGRDEIEALKAVQRDFLEGDLTGFSAWLGHHIDGIGYSATLERDMQRKMNLSGW